MRKLHTPGKGIPALAAGPIIGAGIAAAALFLTVSAKAAKIDAEDEAAESLGSVSEASEELSFSDSSFGDTGSSLFDGNTDFYGYENRSFHIPWISGAGSGTKDPDYAGNSIYSEGTDATHRGAGYGATDYSDLSAGLSGESSSGPNVSPSQPGGYISGTGSSPVIHITPASGNVSPAQSAGSPAAQRSAAEAQQNATEAQRNAAEAQQNAAAAQQNAAAAQQSTAASSQNAAASAQSAAEAQQKAAEAAQNAAAAQQQIAAASAQSKAEAEARAQALQRKIDSLSSKIEQEAASSRQSNSDSAAYTKALSEMTGQLNELKRQLSSSSSAGITNDTVRFYELQLENLKQQLTDIRISNEREIRRLERENDDLKNSIRDLSNKPGKGGGSETEDPGKGEPGKGGSEEDPGKGSSGEDPGKGGSEEDPGKGGSGEEPGEGGESGEDPSPKEEAHTVISGTTGDDASTDVSGTAYPIEIYTNENDIITVSLKDLYRSCTADVKAGVSFTYDNPDPLYCATDPTASRYALFIYGTKDQPTLCDASDEIIAPKFELSDKWTCLGYFRSGKKDGDRYSAEYFTSNLTASTDTTAGQLYQGSSSDDACRTFAALVPVKTWANVEATGAGTSLPDGSGNYTMQAFVNGSPFDEVKVMNLYSLTSGANDGFFTKKSESSRYALYMYGSDEGFKRTSDAPDFNAKSSDWIPLGRFSSGKLAKTGEDPAGWTRCASYYLSTMGESSGVTESVLPDESKNCYIALVPLNRSRAVVKAQGKNTSGYELTVYPDGDVSRDVVITNLKGLLSGYSSFDDVMSPASVTARDSSDARYALFVFGNGADSSNLVDTASEKPVFDLQSWTCLGRFRNAENGQATFFKNGVNGYAFSSTGGVATSGNPGELWFALVPLENYRNIAKGASSEASYKSLDLYVNGCIGDPVRVTTLTNLYNNMNGAPFNADKSENAKYALFLYSGLSDSVPVFNIDDPGWQLIGRYQGRSGSTADFSAKYFTTLSGDAVKSIKAVKPEDAKKTYIALVPLKKLYLDLGQTTLTIGESTDTAQGSAASIRNNTAAKNAAGNTLSCSADTTAERYGFRILDTDGSKNNLSASIKNDAITVTTAVLGTDSAKVDTALTGQEGQVYTSSAFNVNTKKAVISFTGGKGSIALKAGSDTANPSSLSEGNLTLKTPRKGTVTFSATCDRSDSKADVKNKSISVAAAATTTVVATCDIPYNSSDHTARTNTVTAQYKGTDSTVISATAKYTWEPAAEQVVYTGKALKSTAIATAINKYAYLGNHFEITYQTHKGECQTIPKIHWTNGKTTIKTPAGKGFNAVILDAVKYYGYNYGDRMLRLTTYPVSLYMDGKLVETFGYGGCEEDNKDVVTWENNVDITITRVW